MRGPKKRSLTIAAALVWLAVVSGGGLATAATHAGQKNGVEGCVTETGSSGQCLDGRGLVGAASIAISPDGANAYVASSSWSSVSILSRDPATGMLTPVSSTAGCLESLPGLYPDCTPVDHLDGAYDIAVSPDGQSVYIASPMADAIVVFERSLADGLLTPRECVNEDGSGGCVDGRALSGAASIAFSPDGANLYVASTNAVGGLAVFDRDSNSGGLEQKGATAGCINESAAEGCADGADQMSELRDIAISPDGKSAYAVSRGRDAVTIFRRALPSGELTPLSPPMACVNEQGAGGCLDGTALLRAEAVAVTPDGANVYVAGERSDSIAVFDRNTVSGALSQKPGDAGCISDTGHSNKQQESTAGDCEDGTAMDGLDSIAVLPDGSGVYAAARDSSAIDAFERHPDGTLTQLPGTEGCTTETGRDNPGLAWTAGDCEDGRALLGASRLILSEDGDHLYSAAVNGGIGVFDVLDPSPDGLAAQTVDESLPSGTSRGETCRRALVDVRQARRHLEVVTRSIRRLLRRGSLARSDRNRLRHARRDKRRWAKSLRRAQKLKRESC